MLVTGQQKKNDGKLQFHYCACDAHRAASGSAVGVANLAVQGPKIDSVCIAARGRCVDLGCHDPGRAVGPVQCWTPGPIPARTRHASLLTKVTDGIKPALCNVCASVMERRARLFESKN